MAIKVKIKGPKKGGYRIPNKLRLGTQRLLKCLWDLNGGPKAMGELTGENSQTFIGWRSEGKVSLKKVGRISRLLTIPKEALNYEEVGEFLGVNNPWESVVKVALKSNAHIEWVLKGVYPKEYVGDE